MPTGRRPPVINNPPAPRWPATRTETKNSPGKHPDTGTPQAPAGRRAPVIFDRYPERNNLSARACNSHRTSFLRAAALWLSLLMIAPDGDSCPQEPRHRPKPLS